MALKKQLRLVLRGVEVTTLENGNCRLEVTLAYKGKVYKGEAISSDTEEGQMAAVVQATVQAVRKALTKPVEMRVVYNRQIFLSEVAKVILLVIIQLTERSNTFFVPGICLFTASSLEVAAKATLNALNRSLPKYA